MRGSPCCQPRSPTPRIRDRRTWSRTARPASAPRRAGWSWGPGGTMYRRTLSKTLPNSAKNKDLRSWTSDPRTRLRNIEVDIRVAVRWLFSYHAWLSPEESARPPYSMDLRQRVFTACDAGLRTAAVAATYRLRASWVRRLKPRRRQTGAVAPRAARPGPRPSWDGYADRLREAIGRTPDATSEGLRDQLGLPVALSTRWRAVAALGWSVKRKVPRAAEQDRPDVQAQGDAWRAQQPA